MKIERYSKIPMNLQLFADPAPAAGGGGGAPAGQLTQNQPAAASQSQSQTAAAPQIDYAKIQQMLDGTLSA